MSREPRERDPNGPLITVQDVHNAIAEHMKALDELWPDDDRFGPRKVHIVELIDGIKLRLTQRAEANLNRYVSPFEKAASKLMGPAPALPPREAGPMEGKTAMQLAHEQAQARRAMMNKGS